VLSIIRISTKMPMSENKQEFLTQEHAV